MILKKIGRRCVYMHHCHSYMGVVTFLSYSLLIRLIRDPLNSCPYPQEHCPICRIIYTINNSIYIVKILWLEM